MLHTFLTFFEKVLFSDLEELSTYIYRLSGAFVTPKQNFFEIIF